jgi:hypothetical protein
LHFDSGTMKTKFNCALAASICAIAAFLFFRFSGSIVQKGLSVESEVNLGVLEPFKSYEFPISIRNDTSRSVVCSKFQGSCGCLVIKDGNGKELRGDDRVLTVAPDSSTELKVLISTTSFTSIAYEVTFQSDIPEQPRITVTIKGDCPPPFRCSVKSLIVSCPSQSSPTPMSGKFYLVDCREGIRSLPPRAITDLAGVRFAVIEAKGDVPAELAWVKPDFAIYEVGYTCDPRALEEPVHGSVRIESPDLPGTAIFQIPLTLSPLQKLKALPSKLVFPWASSATPLCVSALVRSDGSPCRSITLESAPRGVVVSLSGSSSVSVSVDPQLLDQRNGEIVLSVEMEDGSRSKLILPFVYRPVQSP